MESSYEIKYFNGEDEKYDPDEIKAGIPTTNYTVPFDFNGKQFLWVEFLSGTQRNICLSNIPLLKSDKLYKHLLEPNIGHISQAKLISNDKVFIVHSLNKCEIRQLNNDFTLLDKFEHIGEEVLAIDVVLYNNNLMNNNPEEINKDVTFFKDYKKDISKKKKTLEPLNINTNTRRILETSDIQQNNKNQKDLNGYEYNENLTIKQNRINDNLENNINNYCFATLDVDGNVNLYKNKKEINLFNLFNIEDIPQDHKDKNFFGMGYAYYMKTDLNYFCISSDHGCYIIKSNN
jgi:hypothetical protein